MTGDSLFFCLRNGELVAANESNNQDARLAAADSWLVDDGRVRALDAHFDRFRSAIQRVAPDHESYLDDFFAAVTRALPRTGRWFPRIEFHADNSSEHHLHLRLREAPEALSTATLWSLDEPDPRVSPSIKGPDLSLGQQLRRRAKINGADEAVLLDQNGFILEGALSSMVWWRDGVLCAPGPDLPWLPSVTRDLVWSIAEQTGAKTKFETVKPQSLNGLEIWLLSSLHGIRVVTGWSDLPDGPATARHAESFNRRLRMLSKALD
jgi:branched-subunit amino acid aminotransferase/4-amino-4-deoxychorismate lyase